MNLHPTCPLDLRHTVQRIFSRCIEQVGPLSTPCWRWPGTHVPKGYGTTSVGSARSGKPRGRYTHRLVAEAFYGPPDGRQVDHLCRQPDCCNPDHLEYVTPLENSLRSPRCQSIREQRCKHCGSTDGRVTNPSHGRVKWYCYPCKREKARVDRARKREAS